MITRGHFIGQIIDELSDISHQVETRCGLGLTDLNRHLENFFKDVLNTILDLNLGNLNAERSNNPGLDLADPVSKKAFQITSTKTSQKINKTLEKVTDDDLKKYDTIYVLIVGRKQGSYTLDGTQCGRCRFGESNIWDMFDLCKLSMDMPLDRLQKLFDYIRSEVARVKIELEFPTEEGKFPTSITDYVENIPRPRIGSCEEYCRVRREIKDDFEQGPGDVQKDLEAMSARLARLPRITREFFAFLLERRDEGSNEDLKISNDKLRRICTWPDINGELRLLEAEGFVRVYEPEHGNAGGHVTMRIRGLMVNGRAVSDYFHLDFLEFMHRKAFSFQKVIGNLDFGEF